MHFSVLIFATALTFSIGVLAAPPDLRVAPLDLPAVSPHVPKIPYVADADNVSWQDGKPVWEASKLDVGAKLSLAATRRSLLLHLVVQDPAQGNDFHGRNLWRGDCVYLSLDARGDTTPEHKANNTFEPDDATYIFALGDQGPEGRVSNHGNPHRVAQPCTEMIRSLVRDEAAKTTTYDLEIPWSDVATAHGQSPTMGLALIVAHKNSAGEDLPWGRIRANADGPRELHTLALDTGEGPFASIAPKLTRVTGDAREAEATVAVRAPVKARLLAKIGDAEQSVDIAPAAGVQRFRVSVPVARLQPDSATLAVSVGSESKDVVAAQSFAIATPALDMAKLDARVAKLLATAPNDIVREHLDSTRIVVRSCYEKLALERAARDAEDDMFMNVTEMVLDKLPTDRFDFEDHVSRGLPFVFAFRSESDYSLQFAALQLPYDWQPGEAYPLTVYLHGACDNHPISGLSTAFDNSHQDTLFDYEKLDPADVPPLHRGYLLAPWARGTSGYENAAEDDVWQSLRLVKERFSVDEDRQYMTGFSMGCFSALRLAAETPDQWAGLNLASGLWAGSEDMLDNLPGLPIALWAGELDSLSEGMRAFAKQCQARGVTHRLRIAPNLPHTYPYAEYKANVAYLMQFTRPERPDQFSYEAIEGATVPAGAYGITLRAGRQLGGGTTAGPPRMTCRIAGDTIRIESENARGAHIVLGEGGLGLSGNVKVLWNGRTAYEGEAKTIDLSQ